MKIFLAPSTIKAVCDLCIKAIDDARATTDSASEAMRIIKFRFLWWRWNITRTDEALNTLRLRQGGFPSRQYEEQYTRVLNLRAIARHKMTAGLIEVPDPYLSDIAQFLGPDEDMRL